MQDDVAPPTSDCSSSFSSPLVVANHAPSVLPSDQRSQLPPTSPTQQLQPKGGVLSDVTEDVVMSDVDSQADSSSSARGVSSSSSTSTLGDSSSSSSTSTPRTSSNLASSPSDDNLLSTANCDSMEDDVPSMSTLPAAFSPSAATSSHSRAARVHTSSNNSSAAASKRFDVSVSSHKSVATLGSSSHSSSSASSATTASCSSASPPSFTESPFASPTPLSFHGEELKDDPSVPVVAFNLECERHENPEGAFEKKGRLTAVTAHLTTSVRTPFLRLSQLFSFFLFMCGT